MMQKKERGGVGLIGREYLFDHTARPFLCINQFEDDVEAENNDYDDEEEEEDNDDDYEEEEEEGNQGIRVEDGDDDGFFPP